MQSCKLSRRENSVVFLLIFNSNSKKMADLKSLKIRV